MLTMQSDKLVVVGAVLFVLVALSAMATLHERHYKERRSRILDARLQGVEARIHVIEEILREDRLT
jgi:hypothetical protein